MLVEEEIRNNEALSWGSTLHALDFITGSCQHGTWWPEISNSSPLVVCWGRRADPLDHRHQSPATISHQQPCLLTTECCEKIIIFCLCHDVKKLEKHHGPRYLGIVWVRLCPRSSYPTPISPLSPMSSPKCVIIFTEIWDETVELIGTLNKYLLSEWINVHFRHFCVPQYTYIFFWGTVSISKGRVS